MTFCILACFDMFYVFILVEIHVRDPSLVQEHIKFRNVRENIPKDHSRVLEEGPFKSAQAVKKPSQPMEAIDAQWVNQRLIGEGAQVHTQDIMSSVDGLIYLYLIYQLPMISNKQLPPHMGRRPGHWPSITIYRWIAFRQSQPPTWVLPQGPLVGPWGCLLGLFQPKHNFLRVKDLSHEFYPKKQVKLVETCIDTQGRFKANFSSAMDV